MTGKKHRFDVRGNPGRFPLVSDDFVGISVGILGVCWYRPFLTGTETDADIEAMLLSVAPKPRQKPFKLSDGGRSLFVGAAERLPNYGDLHTGLMGKQKLLALGPYPVTSLSDARALARCGQEVACPRI